MGSIALPLFWCQAAANSSSVLIWKITRIAAMAPFLVSAIVNLSSVGFMDTL